jgi:predicted nucleic acid-binding protein
LELLQGCRKKKELEALKSRLGSFESCSLENLSWEKLYLLAFILRKKGVTVPTLDILIAYLCIEKDYILLHYDHHFRVIAQHSELNAIDFLEK